MPSAFCIDNVPQEIKLEKDRIDVWCVSLDVNEECFDSFQQILSEDEHTKAQRMRIEKPRKNYVAARGILRFILSAYAGKKPELITFQYGENGKPGLNEKFNGKEITFNMSHSHGLALCCVALERSIGADIEKIREDISIIDIARRFFSDHEYKELISLPAALQRQGFFCCWTRKEAYLKATGQGITFPLSDFDVSLTPGAPAELIKHRTKPEQTSMWSIVDLDVAPDFAAALVAEGKDFRLVPQKSWSI